MLKRICPLLICTLLACGSGGSVNAETETEEAPQSSVEKVPAKTPTPQASKPKPDEAPEASAIEQTPVKPYYPPLIVKIVSWGDGAAGQVNAAVPEMRKEFKEALGIELDLKFFDLGDPLPDLVPQIRDAFYWDYLRGIVGSSGALLVVSKNRMDYKLPNGHDVNGLTSSVGCFPQYCQSWGYVGPYSAIAVLGNLMAYEIGHLLGTPGGADLDTLGAIDLKKQIEKINRGGA